MIAERLVTAARLQLQDRRTIGKPGGTISKSHHPMTAEPLANLAEPLSNLVILSTDAFYRGEGSAFRFWIAGRHFVLVECGERQMQILRPKKRSSE
jgi:hypothetical protein